MHLIFKDPETLQRMREGPLGPYVDSYAADMHQQGYTSPTAEAQIRLVVTDFSRWLAKRQIAPSNSQPTIVKATCESELDTDALRVMIMQL